MQALVAAVLAVVCFGAASAHAQDNFLREERSLKVDGLTRHYTVYRPRLAQRPLPVLLGLHGGYGSGDSFEQHARLLRAKGAEDFIHVHPDGYRRSWNAGECCGAAAREQIDDTKFLRTVLDTLAAEPGVDGRRSYVTGFSTGAKMAYRLACDIPERLGAVAPVSAALSMAPEDCKAAQPVPMLHIHGLMDEWAPYEGGVGKSKPAGPQRSVPETLAFWTGRYHCTDTQTVPALDGARCAAHRLCNDGVAVTLCTVSGLGHQWPGDDPSALYVRLFGPATPDVHASDTILEFFKRVAAR